MNTKTFSFILTLLIYSLTGFAQSAVSIESLLKEMVDRDALPRYPEPAYTCKQFSSYDRASVAKDQPGWFANFDCSMFIRVEKNDGRREFVMMDTEGPGAIVRFWMTFVGKNGGQGTMRIYIDNNPQPAIIGKAFDILSGNLVSESPLAASVSELSPYETRGHNLYFPIPYAKRCKVTYESDYLFEDQPGKRGIEVEETVYYNINYRTYEQGIKVVPYSGQQVKRNRSLVANVLKQLREKERNSGKLKLATTNMNANLAPGESTSFTIKGANAVRHLRMQVNASNREQALRSTVLEISFDGEKTVWTPVGDFFGIGYQQLASDTWYTYTAGNGSMDAFWVMPFEKECTITLHNLGEQKVEIINALAGHAAWKWDNRSMHFGASWKQYTHVYTGRGDEGFASDLNFATLKGRGVYVGDGIALFNTSHAWWGEGDEKVYVDGETFPSNFGTGTEDYYGYAWCRPEPFTGHPFIAQPCGKGSFAPDYSVNNRYRSLDRIPFTTSLVFDMELWHWAHTRINYAPTSFWYMLPGGKKLTAEDIAGAKEPVAQKASDIYTHQLTMTIEGESMAVRTKPAGIVETQTRRDIWSDGKQIFWKQIEKGNQAHFEFESFCAGEFVSTAIFTIAPDYGKFNVYLNHRKIAENLDLYHPTVSVKEIVLDRVSLRQGWNTLTIELADYPQGHSRACFGIDKLSFRKVTTPTPSQPANRIPFADPYIMLHEGTYYAYGTSSNDGIAVCTSHDLYTWEKVDKLALNKADVWGDHWFWAPEVYHVNGKFYMYYSANEHICVAVGDSPLGPFRQEVEKPMVENEKCIDNTLFIDDDGKPYMFYDRFNDGLNIWMAELKSNLTDMKPETLHKCINVSQDWETVWPRVNEGSFVIRHNGVYYMTYSANSYESQFYGIGVATATNINGPWTKYADNPIFQKPDNLVGVGHSAMFTDKEGKMRIVFHAHNDEGKIHPRHMYIGTVYFEQENGKEVMRISPDYITPVWKTNP